MGCISAAARRCCAGGRVPARGGRPAGGCGGALARRPGPRGGEALRGEIRNSVMERLIELVERQALEIQALREELRALRLQVNQLSRTGFPHTLELKLDGRTATYSLGDSSKIAATSASDVASASS